MKIEESNSRENLKIKLLQSFFKAGIIVSYSIFAILELFAIILSASVPPSGNMKLLTIGIVVLVLQTVLMIFSCKFPKVGFLYIVFLILAVVLNSFRNLMIVELGSVGLIFFILVLAVLACLYIFYISCAIKIVRKK